MYAPIEGVDNVMERKERLHESCLALCQEAMGALRQEQTLKEITPTAPSKVERVCYRFYETSRHEVLTSYGWSFVREEKTRCSQCGESQERLKYAIPGDSIRILACYGESGHKVEFTTRSDGYIYSAEPVRRIVYIVDEEDVDKWPVKVRKTFALCLAKNVAMEITGRLQDLQFVTQQYNAAMQEARTEDARQNGTGCSVYGRNHLHDCMLGRKDPFRRVGL